MSLIIEPLEFKRWMSLFSSFNKSILGQHFLTKLKRSLLIPVNLEHRNNTCCSSSISEILSALQNTHSLSFRGIFENLPVSIAILWLLILILVRLIL